MDKEKIHTLIDRYFDGDTSLEEERWLRENLPSLIGEDQAIDEAVAVMDFASAPAAGRPDAGFRRRRFRPIAAAAASLAVLIAAAGICLFVTGRDSKDSYMAYSGGVKLDREETMDLIAAQMEELSEASRSVRADVEDNLADFRQLIEEPRDLSGE